MICLCRWVLLDDQSLCKLTTSSFVYGAVAIGASIYVVGELDTGNPRGFLRSNIAKINVSVAFLLSELISQIRS